MGPSLVSGVWLYYRFSSHIAVFVISKVHPVFGGGGVSGSRLNVRDDEGYYNHNPF